MIILTSYRYESNALFVREHLKNHGVFSLIEETQNEVALFNILIDEGAKEKAHQLISKLNIEEETLDSESEGYLAGHTEWSTEMYNPGYYTGGQTPHYLFDKSIGKFYGLFFLFTGLFAVYFLAKNGFQILDLETILFSLVYIFAGYSIWKQYRKRKTK